MSIETLVTDQGWSMDTMLTMALDYIATDAAMARGFRAYCQEKADAENLASLDTETLRQHLLDRHGWDSNPEGIAGDDLETLYHLHSDDHDEGTDHPRTEI